MRSRNAYDPFFCVSSAIFLDQLASAGATVSTLAIDPTQVTSSFASKFELGLNISTDGLSVNFMGYRSPMNAPDVSNANTEAASSMPPTR